MNGNGGSRILYTIISAMFTINLALVGVVYKSLDNGIVEVRQEQQRRTSRISTLEAQVGFNERVMSELKIQLTRIESEVIALRIMAGTRVR